MKEISDPLRPLADVLKPDVRQENLAQSLADVHAYLSGLTLRDQVPAGVCQLFETAKNARLYTYFVYPFHQVAEMLAYQALERALKERWNTEIGHRPSIDDAHFRWPGLAALLRTADREGWISNAGFSGRWWRAQKAIRAERTEAAMRTLTSRSSGLLQIEEPTEAEIAERAERIDVVAALAGAIPLMRNSLAHGSTKLMPMSDAILQDVRDAINMLFEPQNS